MPIIEFLNDNNSHQRVEQWAKELWKSHYRKPFFDDFIDKTEITLTFYQRMKWKLAIKYQDIKVALKIIFKGDYPDEYYD